MCFPVTINSGIVTITLTDVQTEALGQGTFYMIPIITDNGGLVSTVRDLNTSPISLIIFN